MPSLVLYSEYDLEFYWTISKSLSTEIYAESISSFFEKVYQKSKKGLATIVVYMTHIYSDKICVAHHFPATPFPWAEIRRNVTTRRFF